MTLLAFVLRSGGGWFGDRRGDESVAGAYGDEGDDNDDGNNDGDDNDGGDSDDDNNDGDDDGDDNDGGDDDDNDERRKPNEKINLLTGVRKRAVSCHFFRNALKRRHLHFPDRVPFSHFLYRSVAPREY